MTDEKCAKCQGRPRSEKTAAAIMEATLALLEKKPLRELTIEAIARRAGAGKATIYKWWPSKACLALDAFLTSTQMHVELPDTGSARSDFIAQLSSLIRFFQSKTGHIFCQFLVEGQTDPQFAEKFRKGFLAVRRRAVGELLERGIARGQIRPGLDRELMLDLIYGPVVYRLLAGHAPLNEAEAVKLVGALFDGLGAGGETRKDKR